MNDIIIESLGGLVIKYKMGMDHSNEHSWNRSQKQLIETPDPQFNSGLSSRGMEYRARKSIFYQITAVNFFDHFRPFSTIFT